MFELAFIEQNYSGQQITEREAVRGVVFHHGKLLMINDISNTVKFPGGGIEINEDHYTALKREIAEETGYINFRIIRLIGKTIQQKPDMNDDKKIFKMTSYYYLCELLDEENIGTTLDAYEEDLRFKCQFMTIASAIMQNEKNNTIDNTLFKWAERELAVLYELKRSNLDSEKNLRINLGEIEAIGDL